MFVGPYELLSRIGDGSMGTVDLARAPNGQLVVLKRPRTDDENYRDLLVDEARIGLRLEHDHIVETLDFFEDGGTPVLVLAFVTGGSLADLRLAGPLPIGVVANIGAQIAGALLAIHTADDENGLPLNIVHRDVTPANIMVGHDGKARLIDLGIARSRESIATKTRTGCLRGTLRYLAPEVLKTAAYSPASDFWALGVALCEAALGRPAIVGSEPDLFVKIINGTIPELRPGEQIAPRLQVLLDRLLDRDPHSRGEGAAAIALALRALAETENVSDETTAKLVAVRVGERFSHAGAGNDRAATENFLKHATRIYGMTTEDLWLPESSSKPDGQSCSDETIRHVRGVFEAATTGNPAPPVNAFERKSSSPQMIRRYADSLRALEVPKTPAPIVATSPHARRRRHALGQRAGTHLAFAAAGFIVGALSIGIPSVLKNPRDTGAQVVDVNEVLSALPSCFVPGETRLFEWRGRDGKRRWHREFFAIPPGERASVRCIE